MQEVTVLAGCEDRSWGRAALGEGSRRAVSMGLLLLWAFCTARITVTRGHTEIKRRCKQNKTKRTRKEEKKENRPTGLGISQPRVPIPAWP